MTLFAGVTAIDAYCERLGPQFWAEPVNAVTNTAFVAAGLWGLVAARRAGGDRWTETLAVLVVLIGIGSFLFHTFADSLTVLLDVIPIWSFVALYVVFTLRRFFRMTWWRTLRGVAIGVAVVAAMSMAMPESAIRASNGSLQYLPAIVAFVVLAAMLRRTRHPAAPVILLGGAIFTVSLGFRTMDAAVCDAFPLGTHFLWHLCNAAMLACLLHAAVRHGRPKPTTA